LYWLCVIVAFLVMRYREVTGHWPLMKPKGSPLPGAALEAEDQGSEKDAGRGDELSGEKTVPRETPVVAV
jgi:high-affinity iron transporter